jgi:uncharacterized membrane protein YedE/YeeE
MNAPRPPSRPAKQPRPYADPYLAGVALGLVLLASFVVFGRGIGVSGGVGGAAGRLLGGAWFERATAPGTGWMVAIVLGVFLGGFASAWRAGRAHIGIDRGTSGTKARLAAAFGGGAVMGIGAVVAHGCTSGQALSGGALLTAGGWSFLTAAFAAAYAATFAMRGLSSLVRGRRT